MDALNELVVQIANFLWNNLLLYLLVGTGILFTIRTGFVQIRRFPAAWKRVFGGFSLSGTKAGAEGMSSFQALATAIAAQVGTGAIAGCATALVSGGPGAIFWMWVAAFFGMSTNYSEAYLAQKTRTTDEYGRVIGGPAFYIRKAFPNKFGKFLASFFSLAIIFALGFMGNMVQSNSISDAFSTAFGVPKLFTGIFVAAIAGFIFIGGIGRIASFTEKVVPIMAGFYLLGGLIVLICNYQNIIPSIVSIFVGAFSPRAVGGSVAGLTVRQAMRYGIARGLFANEAGMGSTPHAHALAQVKRPQDQGETAMIGVFIDTYIVLTMTALVILSSGILDYVIDNGITGVSVAQMAFMQSFGSTGSMFIAICLLFFAFSTIISWYFFATINVMSLFGADSTRIFAVLVIICIVIGAVLKVDLVWNLADLFNGLMVIPNLVALLALSGLIAKAAHEKE